MGNNHKQPERTNVGERLREYEKVVEGLEEMIAVVDRDYRYVLANRAFLKHRGMKERDQVVGHLISEVLDADVFERVIKQKLDECFEGRVVRYELTYHYPEIGERILSIAYFPIDGPDGIDRVACVLRDITDQRRAEDALREAEQKYRDIFENASEGVFQTTPEGEYIAANPALARMHGFESADELIRSLKDITRQVYVDPLQRQEFKHLIEAQGFVRGFEHQIFRRDGSKIWVSVNARAVRDKQGEILYYEGTTQDINERKRAEAKSAAFATLARKLSGATTKLGAARTIAEMAGELFGWDSCHLDLYDADRDLVHPMLTVDIIEGRAVEIADPSPGRKPTARSRRIIDHGPALVLRENPIKFDKDSIPFGDKLKPSASIMTVPIRHASTIVGLLSIQSYTPLAYNAAALNDLQSLADHCGEALNRINVEESFYESEERFRQMAHNFEDVVWLSNRDISKVLYINPAYEKVFRRTCESVYERLTSFLEAVHPEDRPRVEDLLERQRKGHHEPIEYRVVWPDGSVRWIHRRSLPIRNTEGEVYLVAGIAQDITERKRAEEALKSSEQDFRRLFEQAHDAILVFDPEHEIVLDVNERACEVYGFTRAEFIGMSLQAISTNVVRGKQEIRETLERGDYLNFETLQRRKDGTEMFLEINASTSLYQGRLVILSINRDVTERNRAQVALRESEKKYRDLVETAHDLIWAVDAEGRITFMNQASRNIYGYEPEELIGRSYFDLLSPEERTRQLDVFPQLMGGGEKFVLGSECEVMDREGNRHMLLANAVIRFDQQGNAIGSMGTSADITERKRAEESLNLFRNLIEQSTDAIEVMDPVTLRFVDCNKSAHRSLGYTREEFLALTVFDIDPLINRSTLAVLDEGMKESGFATVESVHRRKDGTTFPVEVNVKLVSLEKDYRLAVVRDITGRKRAQEALRESEERYRELFENAKDAIYVHDLGGRYVSVNRAAENLSGYSRDEILGKHYSNFVAPRNLKHARTNLCKKLDETDETIYEVFMITKDKRAVPVEVSSRLIHENGVPVGVQGIVRDITERKRAHEALQTYSRRLIEAQEAERQHIARELHDEIGQVLTAVKINLQSIQRLGPDSDWMPPLDESIGIVDEALGRVRELSIELRPSLLDDLGLSAALRWYVDRYAQRTGIRAEVMNGFEEEGRLPRQLETACFRIAQEALTNVVRHARANSVSVQLERLRERLVLTITDDGVGFDVEGLFSNASTMAALGLRGMEERALAVRGKIEIESALQNGTRVRATFPFKPRK